MNLHLVYQQTCADVMMTIVRKTTPVHGICNGSGVARIFGMLLPCVNETVALGKYKLYETS